MTYLISPEQTLRVARQMGLGKEDLQLSGVAVLTFSRTIMEQLEKMCALEDAAWLNPSHHPYAAADIVKRGMFYGMQVTALVPPMGASPLACIIEDLAACGIEAIFLACAAWSLGPPVQFGDLIVPSFSIGLDGTSIHYGNDESEVHAAPEVVEALAEVSQAAGARYHIGGNATCEALYRITPQMVESYRARGCLCMENGEAGTLFAAAHALGFIGGALFQPYIDLPQGWDPAVLRDSSFGDTCRLQAEVVLDGACRLVRYRRESEAAKGKKRTAD